MTNKLLNTQSCLPSGILLFTMQHAQAQDINFVQILFKNQINFIKDHIINRNVNFHCQNEKSALQHNKSVILPNQSCH